MPSNMKLLCGKNQRYIETKPDHTENDHSLGSSPVMRWISLCYLVWIVIYVYNVLRHVMNGFFMCFMCLSGV